LATFALLLLVIDKTSELSQGLLARYAPTFLREKIENWEYVGFLIAPFLVSALVFWLVDSERQWFWVLVLVAESIGLILWINDWDFMEILEIRVAVILASMLSGGLVAAIIQYTIPDRRASSKV
jgi:hypothetical protein